MIQTGNSNGSLIIPSTFTFTFTLRLRPAAQLEGRVAVFTTGPAETAHLEADIVHVSRNLANREALRAELARYPGDPLLGAWLRTLSAAVPKR